MARAAEYLRTVKTDPKRAGAYLRNQCVAHEVGAMTEFDLLGKLFDTKMPQIFAESAVVGDGSDWNLTELGILGDISVAVPVTVFDDGNHNAPRPHDSPFPGTLVFTPGALLRNERGHTPADWDEATERGELSPEGYYGIYRRRLLPVLRYVNDHSATPRSALVTVPGLGCGQFAGPFRGRLGIQLQDGLKRILTECGDSLPNIKCVYFDPYSECRNTRHEIHGISLMVRPLRIDGNQTKSQLCRPNAYSENVDEFAACSLYSIVAWDHVSWPGNDFFAGSRVTDDGVKAAATSSMTVLTGVPGQYHRSRGVYLPPRPFATWEAVVRGRMRAGKLRLWDMRAVWRASR